MKITQEVTARLSGKQPYHLAAVADLSRIDLGNGPVVFSNVDMAPEWIRIGTATITLDLVSPDTLTAAAVEGLREQVQAVKAAAVAKVTELEAQINSLLAIPMEQPESA